MHFNGGPLAGAPHGGLGAQRRGDLHGDGQCPTSLTYQWQIESAVGSGTYVDIAGATGATYTVTAGDQKRRIRVLATQP